MTEYLVVTLMLSCYGAILEVGGQSWLLKILK